MISANKKCSYGCVAKDGQKKMSRMSIFFLAISHMVEAFEEMNGTHPELRSFKKIYTDG